MSDTIDLFEQQDTIGVEELRALAEEKAGTCPTCRRTMKVYKFRLGSYARLLIWMYQNERAESDCWLHVPDAPVPEVTNGGGDYAKLEVWGLIERSPTNDDPTKKSSGYWRLTESGRRFLLGKTTEPSHFFYEPPPTRDGVLGFETNRVSIQEALGRHFNYKALMRGEW